MVDSRHEGVVTLQGPLAMYRKWQPKTNHASPNGLCAQKQFTPRQLETQTATREMSQEQHHLLPLPSRPLQTKITLARKWSEPQHPPKPSQNQKNVGATLDVLPFVEATHFLVALKGSQTKKRNTVVALYPIFQTVKQTS